MPWQGYSDDACHYRHSKCLWHCDNIDQQVRDIRQQLRFTGSIASRQQDLEWLFCKKPSNLHNGISSWLEVFFETLDPALYKPGRAHLRSQDDQLVSELIVFALRRQQSDMLHFLLSRLPEYTDRLTTANLISVQSTHQNNKNIPTGFTHVWTTISILNRALPMYLILLGYIPGLRVLDHFGQQADMVGAAARNRDLEFLQYQLKQMDRDASQAYVLNRPVSPSLIALSTKLTRADLDAIHITSA